MKRYRNLHRPRVKKVVQASRHPRLKVPGGGGKGKLLYFLFVLRPFLRISITSIFNFPKDLLGSLSQQLRTEGGRFVEHDPLLWYIGLGWEHACRRTCHLRTRSNFREFAPPNKIRIGTLFLVSVITSSKIVNDAIFWTQIPPATWIVLPGPYTSLIHLIPNLTLTLTLSSGICHSCVKSGVGATVALFELETRVIWTYNIQHTYCKWLLLGPIYKHKHDPLLQLQWCMTAGEEARRQEKLKNLKTSDRREGRQLWKSEVKRQART